LLTVGAKRNAGIGNKALQGRYVQKGTGNRVTDRPMKPSSGNRERRVFDALHRAALFCDQKIGWNRIGVALSLTIIAIALVALYRILRTINGSEVVEALVTTDWRDIALAASFVAGGYITLTFYDLFALRTIGRPDVPYWAAALAGFTSYSVGHNVGASVLTGGAVRYRIYSAWGLNAVDVAKICFVAGLTFWLGNATVLGLGIAYVPQAASAINQLPAWFNRAGAFLILVLLALYVAWVWRRPRVVGREGWCVTLPGGPLTLLQIGIGIVDLGFCALAMYILVPDEPNIGFVTLAVIFVAATLLGFASHAPGGIGVFDAAMLVALWQYDKEDLFAGLLLFRLLYYIVPFALSLLILGGRELLLAIRGTPPPPIRMLPSLAPTEVATKPIGAHDEQRKAR
jgi:glycosyltransferase 2 family protein